MLRTLIPSFFLAVVLLLSGSRVIAAQPQTVTLDVPGMTCRFCPITIRKALAKVPGVIEARADYDSKTATVTFDPDKASVSDLTSATANAGYESSARIER